MDAHLELITNWFQTLGVVANIDKLKRQLSIIDSWFKNGCIGVLEAVTGFGKTYVAIIGIYRLNLKYPDATTIVVVPTTKLYNDWLDHVRDFDLKNVTVYVVNSYASQFVKTKLRYQCDLLVVDEVHRVLSNSGILFNKTITCTDYKMFLGLTATLEQEERDILSSMGITIVDTVSMSEARRFHYISDYIVYNLAIPLSTTIRQVYDQYNDVYNSTWAKFQYFMEIDKNIQLIRAASVGQETSIPIGTFTDSNGVIIPDFRTGLEWRQWYADKMGWDGSEDHDWSPTNIAKYAHQWNWSLQKRKDFLYNSHDKIRVAREILEKFKVPTITFAETTNFVDNLVKELTLFNIPSRAYHSNIKSLSIFEKKREYKNFKYAKLFRQKVNGTIVFDEEHQKYAIDYEKEIKITGPKLKQKIINDFEDGVYNVLCTAKALDEGFNVEGIELVLICSATSKQRNSIQRYGRGLRFKPNKTARIINLYHPDTQDEVWLKKRQKGDTMIRWISSIDEIL